MLELDGFFKEREDSQKAEIWDGALMISLKQHISQSSKAEMRLWCKFSSTLYAKSTVALGYLAAAQEQVDFISRRRLMSKLPLSTNAENLSINLSDAMEEIRNLSDLCGEAYWAMSGPT